MKDPHPKCPEVETDCAPVSAPGGIPRDEGSPARQDPQPPIPSAPLGQVAEFELTRGDLWRLGFWDPTEGSCLRTAAASNYELLQTEHTLTSFSALERDQGTRATAIIFRPFWGEASS